MIIEYTPEGGETQYLDAGRMRVSEIQIIERTADEHWAKIRDAVSEGDVSAMRVVAFVLKKRAEPSLRLSDFDPFEDELRSRLDPRETRYWAERVYAKYSSEPQELADAFDELRESTSDRESCEQIIADVTAPKDPEPEPAPVPVPLPTPQPQPSDSSTASPSAA